MKLAGLGRMFTLVACGAVAGSAAPSHASASRVGDFGPSALSRPAPLRSVLPPAPFFASAVTAAAPSAYHAPTTSEPSVDPVLPNPAGAFRTHFTATGPELFAAHDDARWRVRWQLVAWGADDSLHPLATSAPTIRGNRVEYAHDAVTSWYLNGPLGLEQGFTVRGPAAGQRPPATLSLHLRLDGATVEVVASGSEARVRPAGANRSFRYGPLGAIDATGRPLPCTLSTADGEIVLHVDTLRAVYPVTIDPLIAIDGTELLTSEGAPGDGFGWATAVEGDLAVVGAWAHGETQGIAGAAYVFTREAAGWSAPVKLGPDVSADAPRFGIAVAIDGGSILVGAHHDSTEALEAGSAYVFDNPGSGWQRVQKLLPGDGVEEGRFGITLATSNGTALVGTRAGAAYAFTKSGTEWQLQQKLTASDMVGVDERFGAYVAIEDDTAVVGAPMAGLGTTPEVGAVYVFTRTGATWTEAKKLTPPDGEAYDAFGQAVALRGDTLLVGAPNEDDAGTDAGSVYVFRFDGSNWSLEGKLFGSTIQAGDAFGIALAMGGEVAVIGAKDDADSALGGGAAYLFQLELGTWNERQKLFATDAGEGDAFGYSVATDGQTVLVGAPSDGDLQDKAGSAYGFLVRHENGDPCTDGATCASGFCVDGFCCESACNGGSAAGCSACSQDAGSTQNGVCGFAYEGWTCGAATCEGAAVVHVASTCDGQGTCVDNGVEDCWDGFACKGGACLSSCASEDECAPNHRCEPNGTCFPLVVQGQWCTDNSECVNGMCVDSVCCDTECGGGDPEDCQACSTSAGASQDGTCELLDAVDCAEGMGTCKAGTCEQGGANGGTDAAAGPQRGGCGCHTAAGSARGGLAIGLLLGLGWACRRRRST